MRTTQAHVYGRPFLAKLAAADVRHARPSVEIYRENERERVIVCLRIRSHNSATLETRTLTDFDPVRQVWRHYGPARYEELETRRAIKAQALAMLAEIEAAGLTPLRDNCATREHFYREA